MLLDVGGLMPFCAVSLAAVETLYPLHTVLCAGAFHKLQKTDDEYLTFCKALLPQEAHGPSLPMMIAFHVP
jgi:hypothetical protein